MPIPPPEQRIEANGDYEDYIYLLLEWGTSLNLKLKTIQDEFGTEEIP